MGQADVLATRTAFRDELRKDLMTRANDFYRDLSELAPVADVPTGDETNGHSDIDHEPAKVAVLTRRAFTDLVNDVFEVPLPPPSEHYAEVSTPAKVIVAAECPKCGIAQPIEVGLSPELLVDPDGSELRIKSKTKGRTHVCGQLPLPDAAAPIDQLTLDDAPIVVIDIIPDAPAPTDLLDDDSEVADCKANGLHGDDPILCYRPLDHDGDHYDAQLEATWRVVAPAVAVDEPVPTALACDGSNHVPNCEHFTPEPVANDDLLPA